MYILYFICTRFLKFEDTYKHSNDANLNLKWSLLHFLYAFVAAFVNSTDENGNTPLHLGAYYGQEIVVRVLLASGADHKK